MKMLVHLAWILALLMAAQGCNWFSQYRLVSKEYGFSVEFPEKPIEQPDTNYQGLPKSLWSVERDSSKEFYSAEATSYKEALQPRENWIPNQEALGAFGIRVTDSKRFSLHAAANGREVPAIATRAKQLSTGDVVESIYVVDGKTLISITARTRDEQQREKFLKSLTLLR